MEEIACIISLFTEDRIVIDTIEKKKKWKRKKECDICTKPYRKMKQPQLKMTETYLFLFPKI